MDKSIKDNIEDIGDFLADNSSDIVEGVKSAGTKVASSELGEEIGDFLGETGTAIKETVKDAIGINNEEEEVREFRSKVLPGTSTNTRAGHTGLLIEEEVPTVPTTASNTVPNKIKPVSERKVKAVTGKEVDQRVDAEEEVREFNLNDLDTDIILEEDIPEPMVDPEIIQKRQLLSDLKALKMQAEEGTDTKGRLSKAGARYQYNDKLREWENPNGSGYEEYKGKKKFMPFESIEGTGSDPGNSKYEIGYGVKIKQSWISDNRENWPKINGIPTDIREGISKEKAQEWCLELQDKAYNQAKRSASSAWTNLSEAEKTLWTDLTYNGGAKAIDKNPKAKEALTKGYSVEAALKTLDYIHAGSKGKARSLRGLLNRRLSMYNNVALDLPGVPVIDSYSIEEGNVKVNFSSQFNTDKVSSSYLKKLNQNKSLSFKVKPGMPEGDYKANKEYDFR